ncbi:uncharacterized protein LOC141913851 [Tubulanus polymorphus]|uniref:uncharacterized protein LOC141913851 n=1 Tax=Tubulanus polymorphus TaxID=672921 RepID=UPI003DA2FBE9
MGPIVFRVPKTEQYLDLNVTYLKLQFKIVNADGTNVGPEKSVSMINGAYSLFSDVQIMLNDRVVTHDGGLYPFKCEPENMVNYNSETKNNSWLQCDLYAEDEAGKKSNIDPTLPNANSGLVRRNNYTKGSKMFPPPKTDFRIKIESAQLYIRKLELDSSVLVAHAKAMEKNTAKYYFSRTELLSLYIPRGHRTIIKDSVFVGEIPKAIVLALVDDDALSGNYKKNPFNFKDYSLNYIGVTIDNVHAQNSPLIIDSRGDGCEVYHGLYLARGLLYKNEGIGIKREDFKNGNFICGFNISPEYGDQTHLSLIKKGSIKIEMRFDEALPHNVNLIVYAVFDELLQVTKERHIEIDY